MFVTNKDMSVVIIRLRRFPHRGCRRNSRVVPTVGLETRVSRELGLYVWFRGYTFVFVFVVDPSRIEDPNIYFK